MSLVLELRKLAFDRNADIQDLLQRAYFTASYLNLDEFRDWANRELNGYEDNQNLPDYRQPVCLFGFLTRFGLQQVSYAHLGEDEIYADLERIVTHSRIVFPVALLVDYIAKPDEYFDFLLPSMAQMWIRRMHPRAQGQPVQRVTRVMLRPILDAIRQTVLKWTIDLQKAGILGETENFNPIEQATAAEKQADLRPHITINFNSITTGPVVNSIIQQLSPDAKAQLDGQA